MTMMLMIPLVLFHDPLVYCTWKMKLLFLFNLRCYCTLIQVSVSGITVSLTNEADSLILHVFSHAFFNPQRRVIMLCYQGNDVHLRVHDTFAAVDLWEFPSFWSNCTRLQIAQREEPGHELHPVYKEPKECRQMHSREKSCCRVSCLSCLSCLTAAAVLCCVQVNCVFASPLTFLSRLLKNGESWRSRKHTRRRTACHSKSDSQRKTGNKSARKSGITLLPQEISSKGKDKTLGSTEASKEREGQTSKREKYFGRRIDYGKKRMTSLWTKHKSKKTSDLEGWVEGKVAGTLSLPKRRRRLQSKWIKSIPKKREALLQ